MTAASPLVSVIIPCFNRETTVHEAVLSVLTQDYDPIELIAVDDNSTDGTIAVLESIDDPRLRILHNSGDRGPSQARNHGIRSSTAPWIAFQDSDDIWLPGKLKRQMDYLQDSDFVAAYCGMLIKKDTHPESPVKYRRPAPETSPLEGDILPSLALENYISTQMLVVRHDILDQIGGFDEALPALVDWELMLRVASLGPVAFIDDDLVVQRMSENSLTHSSKKRLAAQEHILKKHYDLLGRYPGVLAHHHHRIAGGHRALGQYTTAASHGWAAWQAQPGNLRYLFHATYLMLRTLGRLRTT
jgi:glycosyltransferase involved in cell wall biosynthesis|uniref:glycosyltransferase family 2 protein n=1 Tax=Roseovarius sp. BRH_c41 TaxID=1629709 RepID=UPI000AA6C9E3|nr:glycosyltransferase [Roseovarius sp. BRH_c41]